MAALQTAAEEYEAALREQYGIHPPAAGPTPVAVVIDGQVPWYGVITDVKPDGDGITCSFTRYPD